MRWIPFFLIAYILLVFQTTFCGMVTLPIFGGAMPNLLALMAVFMAMNVRDELDAMMAGWFLGFFMDLTVASAGAATAVIGPMSMVYCLLSSGVFRIREAVFRDRALPQMLLAMAFVFASQGPFWATLQAIRAWGGMSLGEWGTIQVSAIGSGIYSGLLMPLVYILLMITSPLLFHIPIARRRKR